VSGKPSFQELEDWPNPTLDYIHNTNKEAVISKYSIDVLTFLGPQQLLPAAEMLSRKFGKGFYSWRNRFYMGESVSS